MRMKAEEETIAAHKMQRVYRDYMANFIVWR